MTDKNTHSKIFNATVEDELLPEGLKHLQETKDLMESLGGNWKRIKMNKRSIFVSDEGKCITSTGRELNYCVQNNGYISYCNTTVHRLVAFAFGLIDKLIDKKGCQLDVDHIDEDKTNNALSNLRVISHSENIKKRDRNGFKRCIKVDAYDYESSEYLNTYNSYKEAAEALNVFSPDIYYCTIGKMAQTKGYSFRKHGDQYIRKERKINLDNRKRRGPTKHWTDKYALYKDDQLIGKYHSVNDMTNIVNASRVVISGVLHRNKNELINGYLIKRIGD